MIDLHTHTNESDGSLSPSALIEAAKQAGLRSLAITDHDTFAGYLAALEPASNAGIDLVRGIEMSSKDGAKAIHVLGYFLREPPPEWFLQWLQAQGARRKDRNQRLAARFAELGIDVSLEEAEALGRTITGRVHFARVLVRKGFASSIQDAFMKYLGENAPAYVEVNDPPSEEVVELLRKAGAISSVAHLARYGMTPDAEDRFVARMRNAGLTALEVIHTDHTKEDVARCSMLALKYGLLATGGSDFHGNVKPGVRLGYGNAGKTEIPSEWLDRLRATVVSIADLRENYTHGELLEEEAPSDPFVLFRAWFADAERTDIRDVNAMSLATSTIIGSPSVRTVLLKGIDSGFLFFTNYNSQKGRELEENPQASLCFYWRDLERQVRITGHVAKVSREESNEYFHSRPRGSQLGAWASPQSSAIQGRAEIEQRYLDAERQFANSEIPLPEYWGGYRLVPQSIEFWQGRPNRLHDRLLFERIGDGWTRKRLAP